MINAFHFSKHIQESLLDLTYERKDLKDWFSKEAISHTRAECQEKHTRLKRIEKVLNYYYIKRKGL